MLPVFLRSFANVLILYLLVKEGLEIVANGLLSGSE